MGNSNFPTLTKIKEASQRIRPFIHKTPVLKSTAIDKLAGCRVFFKCENFQKVGAFKARGASNAVLKLQDSIKQKGVATHSSGNHAAALAKAASQAGIPSFIVMPTSAPTVKIDAVKEYGGEITFCEPTLEARERTLMQVVEETGASFIPPYDHWDIIEGQATCALEFLEEIPSLESIMAPVGGGGLLAGTALSASYLSSTIKVYGAEPLGADDAFKSFKAGKRIPMTNPKTIADGLLTSLGERNFSVIMELVEDILTVEDKAIVTAMRLIYERLKIVVEPSCAVPLAALLANKEMFLGQEVGIILSGGNVDLTKLPF
ncbi:pyridoxal-phosphate dependent enzyme [Pleomorphovibrio marinus]|uniref:pyridoxal-phosphate dependent enzyme n=1 Tax=Pleomorphovibrio marinus TaxID=2164132 RepID=UPI000E0B49C5|nr:pyridoxal-phosphate dependent enzyme [Pleomorphovibrio marinus]